VNYNEKENIIQRLLVGSGAFLGMGCLDAAARGGGPWGPNLVEPPHNICSLGIIIPFLRLKPNSHS